MLSSVRILAIGALVAAVLAATPGSAPSAGDPAVTVTGAVDGHASRCSKIREVAELEFAGGCLLNVVRAQPTEVTLHSVVGDLPVGSCEYDFDLRVDGSGRTQMELVFPSGPNPCNDLDSCMHGEPRPWPGQIKTDEDGRIYNHARACLDTCLGQFRGDVRLYLDRRGEGWRATVEDDLVGPTGLELDGSWDLGGRDLEIRPAS